MKLKIYGLNWYVFAFLTKSFLRTPHEKMLTFKFAMRFCYTHNFSKSRDAMR